jgi:hypothetical protein
MMIDNVQIDPLNPCSHTFFKLTPALKGKGNVLAQRKKQVDKKAVWKNG